MNKIIVLIAALVFSPLAFGQRVAETAKLSSERLLQKIGPINLEKIENDSILIKKLDGSVSLNNSTTMPLSDNQSDFGKAIIITPYRFKGAEIIDRVVPKDITDNLTSNLAQSRISTEFCPENESQECKDGLKKYGISVFESKTKRTSECTNFQKQVSLLSGFNDGDANSMSSEKLHLIASYHLACTTDDIPIYMKNILGIIIDTNEPISEKKTGILFPKGKFSPIGMAVQVSKNRIYTARHVLYHDVKDNLFIGKRDIQKLIFIPITAPDQPIFLTKEIRPAALPDDSAFSPFDQTIVEMSQPYTPDLVKWPLLKRDNIVIGAEATPLIIAGFQIALARATLTAKKPNETNIPAIDWPKYVRRDKADSCRRVTQNLSGCILHACDTVGGLSGSPIFARLADAASDQATVIGVHQGAAYNQGNIRCSAGVDGKDLNIGAAPAIALINN